MSGFFFKCKIYYIQFFFLVVVIGISSCGILESYYGEVEKGVTFVWPKRQKKGLYCIVLHCTILISMGLVLLGLDKIRWMNEIFDKEYFGVYLVFSFFFKK